MWRTGKKREERTRTFIVLHLFIYAQFFGNPSRAQSKDMTYITKLGSTEIQITVSQLNFLRNYLNWTA